MRLYTADAVKAAQDAVYTNESQYLFGTLFRVVCVQTFTEGQTSDGALAIVELKELVRLEKPMPGNYRVS